MANEQNLDLFGDPVVEEEPTTIVNPDDDKLHKHDLYDFVRSVKETKVDLRKVTIIVNRGKGKNAKTLTIPPDPELRSLDMYMLIKAISQSPKLAPIAQMMNTMSHLPKEMQYVFLLTAIPAHRSYDKWITKKVDKNLKVLVELFGYTEREAEECLSIFSEEQIASAISERKELNKCKSKQSQKS